MNRKTSWESWDSIPYKSKCFFAGFMNCPVFEIALVRLSETSDYLLGQVNNPLAVIRRTSANVGSLQHYFIVYYHFILMHS